MIGRTAYARRIATLDPEVDFQRIVFLLTCYEFPWDIERALEFALFRTYAVPSISRLLEKTGEFGRRPRKRYDDTELLLAEILEHGFDSERGQRALERINRMHGRFAISNDDFLYVLTTFVLEPMRWIERFGWRALTENEKRAMVNYYRELGRRMGIAGVPHDLAGFERYNQDYESAHFRYTDSNHGIGTITRDLLLSFYVPRAAVGLARPFAHALMDEPLLRAMGFPAAPAPIRILVASALKLRGRLIRLLPARRRPHLLTKVRRPTYPEGYEIEELGTFRR
jgi:hypothetical protein